MTSSTMNADCTLSNPDQAQLTSRCDSVQVTPPTERAPAPLHERSRASSRAALIARSAQGPDTRPKYRLGQPNAQGFKFGPGKHVASAKIPEANLPRIIAGQSLTTAGFELLDAKDSFVSWHECILDAVDALKAHRGPGKVVRCRDRALMKHRAPHKGRP